MRWKITQDEVNKVPPLTAREKFLFIGMSLMFNPVVMGLPLKRRDEILVQLNDKIAKVSPAEWYVIFHSTEALRPMLNEELSNILSKEEMMKVKDGFLNLLGPTEANTIGELAKKIAARLS